MTVKLELQQGTGRFVSDQGTQISSRIELIQTIIFASH